MPPATQSASPTATGVAVDIGGTFTDFVIAGPGGDLLVHKVPSTPADPTRGLLAGLEELGVTGWERFVHGSTVATNALLERRGARTAFLTTAGFRDLLEIGRQTRLDLYSLAPRKHRPLVPRELCFEVEERVGPRGVVLVPLNEEGLSQTLDAVAAAGVRSLAVCLLYSFANPDHERWVAAGAARRGLAVSLSADILPEYREYERASTTVVSAYVAPVMERYLGRLAEALAVRYGRGAAAPPRIMQSNGGIISLERARHEAVRTILSGPAGGVVGGWRTGRQAGLERLITFDMGGTSTDVALIDGEPLTTSETTIDDLPVRIPMLEIHTVGAGGGSLARVDRGGALRVGPGSAGADPGPAAYGRGTRATVTVANLLLGRLYPPAFLGGRMALDLARSEEAVRGIAGQLGLTAEAASCGILRVVNAEMARAVRRVSLERGHDPRRFWLVAFGGAGPVHGCDLAAELAIPRVLVPRFPGALSAVGMLLSDVQKEYSRTLMLPTARVTAAGLGRRFVELERAAEREMAEEGIARDALRLERWLEMRYRGQSYEIAVRGERLMPSFLASAFHARHRRAFRYASEDEPTEIVSLRVKAVGGLTHPGEGKRQEARAKEGRPGRRQGVTRRPWRVFFEEWVDCEVIDRPGLRSGDELRGPALLVQADATTVVPPGWRGRVDACYNVLLASDGAGSGLDQD